jgi:hypothetical protein
LFGNVAKEPQEAVVALAEHARTIEISQRRSTQTASWLPKKLFASRMIDYITKPMYFDRLAAIVMGRLGTVQPSDLQKEWGMTPGRAALLPRLLKSLPGYRAQ